jgi:hypothetical protein
MFGASDMTELRLQSLSALTGVSRPGHTRINSAWTDSEIIIDVSNPLADGDFVQTYVYNSASDSFVEGPLQTSEPLFSATPVLAFRDENDALFAYVDEFGGLWIIDDLKDNPEGRSDPEVDDWILDTTLVEASGMSGAAVLAALPALKGRIATERKVQV